MRGHSVIVVMSLLMSACAAIEPLNQSEMAASIGDPMRPGPGILSGPPGEFVVRLP